MKVCPDDLKAESNDVICYNVGPIGVNIWKLIKLAAYRADNVSRNAIWEIRIVYS